MSDEFTDWITQLYYVRRDVRRRQLVWFSYDMKMLESRKDTTSPRVSSSHAWGVDTAMLRLLHLSDAINLCTV